MSTPDPDSTMCNARILTELHLLRICIAQERPRYLVSEILLQLQITCKASFKGAFESREFETHYRLWLNNRLITLQQLPLSKQLQRLQQCPAVAAAAC